MFKELIKTGIDLLWPRSCHVCSKTLKNGVSAFDQYLCGNCFSLMEKSPQASFDSPLRHETLIACYHYSGPTKNLIQAFKYGQRPYLADTIRRLMSAALKQRFKKLLQKTDLILPVPLYPARQREREFNQSELIARKISERFHKPLSNVLKRIRNTQPQVHLTKSKRCLNVTNAFAVDEASVIKDQRILLIDDVVTTMATVTEAALSLKHAGAQNVSILAFAKG